MKEEVQLGQTTVILIGTGHVFQESVDLVRTTIVDVRPDYVALELDPERFQALESNYKEKPKARHLLKMGLRIAVLGSILSYFQDKVGEETGVFPGKEMLEAAHTARDVNAQIVLIDRPVAFTLQRLIKSISVIDMVRLIFHMLFPSQIELKEVKKETVDELTEELYSVSPAVYKALITERDVIMAQALSALSGTVVAVVGAGHVKGIKQYLMERYKNSEKEVGE
jgi:pheromone shutdown-related protein TraB